VSDLDLATPIACCYLLSPAPYGTVATLRLRFRFQSSVVDGPVYYFCTVQQQLLSSTSGSPLARLLSLALSKSGRGEKHTLDSGYLFLVSFVNAVKGGFSILKITIRQ